MQASGRPGQRQNPRLVACRLARGDPQQAACCMLEHRKARHAPGAPFLKARGCRTTRGAGRDQEAGCLAGTACRTQEPIQALVTNHSKTGYITVDSAKKETSCESCCKSSRLQGFPLGVDALGSVSAAKDQGKPLAE